MAKSTKRQVSDSQKKAMAQGRADGRAIKDYLSALEQNRPRRGRPRTPESIQKKLAEIEAELEGVTDPLRRVVLVQLRMDLEDELERMDATIDIAPLEAAFVKVAKGYSERKGISYAAWREVGVTPDVLRAAGITRGS